MKNLVKLAKQKSRLPILNSIKVEKGVATATNMDICISEPCTLADGLYNSHGFLEGMHIPYEGSINDFPSVTKFGDLLGTVDIAVDDIAFLLPYMSDEATRYYLHGICFKNRAMVSTNGHMLGKIEAEKEYPAHPDFNAGIIVPAEACKFAVLLAKEHRQKVVNVSFYHSKVVFLIGNATIISKLIDGNFPDYNRVIPSESTHYTDFNPAEFAAKKKEYAVLKKVGTGYGFIEINSCASTTFTNVDNIKWNTSTILPESSCYNYQYLLDMPAGKLGWNDPRSPIVIKQDNRLAVLMPTRA